MSEGDKAFGTWQSDRKPQENAVFISYRVSIHLGQFHRSFSTEVVDPDHVICAASSHKHATC